MTNIPQNESSVFCGLPNPVGYWFLYSTSAPYTSFAMYQKPTDEQIANTEKLLGWKWKDAE